MKFLQTKFEDYIIENKKNNLHNELNDILKKDKKLENMPNIIFYGPPGTGKYTQALKYIKTYSQSKLKYERKFNLNYQKKKEFTIKISDIHFEIDMELLGCNAKVLWNDIYSNILDILSSRQNHTGIILCKNFDKIHSELLDIFYSYMQTLTYKNIHLNYVIVAENVSFLPNDILNRCKIIPVKRPTKSIYKKCLGVTFDSTINLNDINNIKDLKTKNKQLLNPTKKISKIIIDSIINYESICFLKLRDDIYNIFIYQLDVVACLKDIISFFIKNEQIQQDKITNVFIEMYKFLKLYNNNYRPIYHLERFIFYLCKIIHGL